MYTYCGDVLRLFKGGNRTARGYPQASTSPQPLACHHLALTYLQVCPSIAKRRNDVSLTLTRQTRTFLDLCTQQSAVITPGAPL